MATIIAVTAIQFSKEEAENFVHKVGMAAVKALELAPQFKDVYLQSIPEGFNTSHEIPRVTFFVYTAPNKTEENKRALVKGIHEAVQDYSNGNPIETIVIVKVHDDENVGVNGVLRKDSR